jgi:hypothetical protein
MIEDLMIAIFRGMMSREKEKETKNFPKKEVFTVV